MSITIAAINPSPSAAGCIRHLFALLSVAVFLLAGVSATDEAGTKYLEEKSKEADVVTLPSGLRYKVLTKGKGGFHPNADSPCLCHYSGTLINGTEFDSSYSKGNPLTFAPNQVIKGWMEAMMVMVEGDKWELYIPSELAYGERGYPGQIPGDAALVFTIEMIEIKGSKTTSLRCDVTTLEDCDDRMKEQISKINAEFGGDEDEMKEEINKLVKMSKQTGWDKELAASHDIRMFILGQMLMKMKRNKKANEEL